MGILLFVFFISIGVFILGLWLSGGEDTLLRVILNFIPYLRVKKAIKVDGAPEYLTKEMLDAEILSVIKDTSEWYLLDKQIPLHDIELFNQGHEFFEYTGDKDNQLYLLPAAHLFDFSRPKLLGFRRNQEKSIPEKMLPHEIPAREEMELQHRYDVAFLYKNYSNTWLYNPSTGEEYFVEDPLELFYLYLVRFSDKILQDKTSRETDKFFAHTKKKQDIREMIWEESLKDLNELLEDQVDLKELPLTVAFKDDLVGLNNQLKELKNYDYLQEDIFDILNDKTKPLAERENVQQTKAYESLAKSVGQPKKEEKSMSNTPEIQIKVKEEPLDSYLRVQLHLENVDSVNYKSYKKAKMLGQEILVKGKPEPNEDGERILMEVKVPKGQLPDVIQATYELKITIGPLGFIGTLETTYRNRPSKTLHRKAHQESNRHTNGHEMSSEESSKDLGKYILEARDVRPWEKPFPRVRKDGFFLSPKGDYYYRWKKVGNW